MWIGDDDNSETAMATQKELSALSASGVDIYIQHGNRDFLLGRRFAKTTGSQLIKTQHTITVNDKRLLLMHGDTLCDNDKTYQYYRLLITFLAPPLKAIIPLKQRKAFIHGIKKKLHSKPNPIPKKISKEKIAAVLRRNRCQTLIHGHLHVPGEETWEDGKDTFTRLCLNDWETGGGYVRINTTNGKIERQ